MMACFLFHYLPSISEGQIVATKSHIEMEDMLPLWLLIDSKVSQKEQMLSVLKLVAFLVSEIMKDF